MALTRSKPASIFTPEGNSLAVFIDVADGTLKLKDVFGGVELFSDLAGGAGLKLKDDALMTTTLTEVVDKDNTPSVLRISTQDVTNYGGGAVTTNTAFGSDALINNTTGSNNTSFGINALLGNTEGASNVALGSAALQSNLSGQSNIGVGTNALNSSSTGNFNTVVGTQSAIGISTGSNNVVLGAFAIPTLNGTNNTILGYNTGQGITTGSNNTILGANVSGLSSTLANNIIIADGSGNRRINVDSSGNVGIGNSINATGFGQKLRVIGQGDASVGIYRNQESQFAAKLEFMKSRGTYDVPTIVNTSDILGNIGYFGYNGTSYINAASISSVALSTATGVEGDIRFTVWNNTGGNVNTMRATKDGVGIGSALDYLPSSRLQIRGAGTTSATTSLLVQNSAGTDSFKIDDTGTIRSGDGYFQVNRYTVGGTVMNIGTGGHFGSVGIVVSGGANAIVANGGTTGIGPNNINGAAIVANGATSGVSLGLLARRALISNGSAFGNLSDSSMLQVDSTTQGFLPPRMTTAQKLAIATPAAGLMVYDTDLNQMSYYNGTTWVNI